MRCIGLTKSLLVSPSVMQMLLSKDLLDGFAGSCNVNVTIVVEYPCIINIDRSPQADIYGLECKFLLAIATLPIMLLVALLVMLAKPRFESKCFGKGIASWRKLIARPGHVSATAAACQSKYSRRHVWRKSSHEARKSYCLEALGTVQNIEHTRFRYPLFQPAQNAKPLNVYWFVLPEVFGLGMCSRMLLFGGGW